MKIIMRTGVFWDAERDKKGDPKHLLPPKPARCFVVIDNSEYCYAIRRWWEFP